MSINTVIDLNGEWKPEGISKFFRVSVSSSSITIDRSAFGLRTAFGMVLNPSTITVTFPSSQNTATLTGTLEQPNRIRWSSGSPWIKVIDLASHLDGFWKAVPDNSPEGPPRARIFVSSPNISINMSDYGRPNANGSILDDFTFTVTFPDGGTFTGKMETRGKITWSNGTVWTRAHIEG